MSLKDKAAKIDFGALPPVSSENRPPQKGARTAPGQMMEYAAAQREDLVAQVDELKRKLANYEGDDGVAARAKQLEAELLAAQTELRQWDDAKGVRLISADEIVPSPYANRHALNFGTLAFRLLLEEIKSAGGNIQPVKVRPLAQPKGNARYELVYGHRRHEACRQLGLPVLALVDNVDDRVMFVEMDRENRSRLDLSPWEQGVMYKRGLDMNLFSSLRALSEEIGLNVSTVSRAVALAELPQEIIDAFNSPMELQYRWAKLISQALNSDREGVLKRAEQLRSEKGTLPGPKVLTRLLAEDVEPESETRPVKVDGKEVGVIQANAKGVQIRISSNVLHNSRIEAFTELLENFLKG
jgi:ParB family chromosome partitioning protein